MILLKIGIFGGTFDPPHKGHATAAAAAVKKLGLDKLLVIPDAQPPHKKLPTDAPEASVRLEMTRLAMENVDKAVVSDIEIARGGRSYTVDTVHQIKEKYPDAHLYLLMGTDMFFCFESWREFKEILGSATLAVFARRDGEEEQLQRFAGSMKKKYSASVKVVANDAVEISSTDLRSLLKLRRGREYLEDQVYREIIKNRLYGARPEFQWLREQAYSMLSPSRIAHVKGCEAEARCLAKRWGVDVEKASEAAILHDITKKDDLETQLALCKKYGVQLDSVEEREVKLLHSKTGAAIARHEYGCDGDVCSAICWHTTGKPYMTTLEKVIYMADYIEPTRDFDGVDKLRTAAYSDLDRALEMGFEMSVQDMQSRGIQPHINTFKALDWIREIIKDKDK